MTRATTLALLALSACTPIAFEAQEIAFVHDRDADRLTIELVHDGLHAPPRRLHEALEWTSRLVAGERVFVLLDWPLVFDLESAGGALEEFRDELPEELAAELEPLVQRLEASVAAVSIESAGLFVDPVSDRLGAWQRVRIEGVTEFLAAWNDFVNRTILEIAEYETPIEGWEIPPSEREVLVEHARENRPWVALKDDAFEVRLPLSEERATEALKALAGEGERLTPEEMQFLASLDEVNVEGNVLVLRHYSDGDGRIRWSFRPSDAEYADLLRGRLAAISTPIEALGPDDVRARVEGSARVEGPARVERRESPAPLDAVPFQRVRIDDDFWSARLETNRTTTLRANLAKCEETGRLRNFAVAAGLVEGAHEGFLYNDSDVYKVIEGAAYTLHLHPDEALRARIDALIDTIAAAQRDDGYLNTYYQLVAPDQRWRNLAHGHELYCAGHLIEAAIAYERATGNATLLGVATRFADLLDATFGPAGKLDPPGHQELELALLKLAEAVGEPRYRALAEWLLRQRGADGRAHLYGEYSQDHRPVLEQRTVTGHAVRAMYQYCAMADVARTSADPRWRETLENLWDDLVLTKMYVTGGVGNSAHNEGFTGPFELPNDTAYAETCAAIGMALWNHRMFLLTREAKYADVLERELYNNVLAGVSLSGDRFFYRNPLESSGSANRVPWFDCSCCPTNVVRYLPGIGERIWATGVGPGGPEVYAVLYVSSTASLEVDGAPVELTQAGDYPWDGRMRVRVDPERPVRFALKLRAPSWLGEGELKASVNRERVRFMAGPVGDDPADVRGARWLTIEREWRPGDTVSLELDVAPRRVHADPRVAANRGRVAVMRGPLVYCAEGIDHGGGALNLVIPPEAELLDRPDNTLLGGVTKVWVPEGAVVDPATGEVPEEALHLVPYAAWNNRGPGEMAVWLIEDPDVATLPGDGVELVGDEVTLRASHCWSGDTLAALDDGLLPASSGDHSIPRHTFWDHRGTEEWLSRAWPEARTVSSSAVYWFDDAGRGQCRVPERWRLLWRDGDEWRPVELVEGAWGTDADRLHEVRFAPVTTTALRLEVTLREGFSAGVLEWSAD